jgi:UDP-N-acetyl-D-mannosaminuronic acid transferase (WecB/TagA/CpsF family)
MGLVRPVCTNPEDAIKKQNVLFVLLAAVCVAGVFLACSKKGPAEKVGAKLDKTVDKVQNAVTPDGPAERAGKKLDKVIKAANDLGR